MSNGIYIEIGWDTWMDHYPLVPNHVNLNAEWDLCGRGGCLFETFGDEFDFVCGQDERCVWTLVDTDEEVHVISGLHYVNGVGHFISRIPVADGVSVYSLLERKEGDDEQ